mgnify:CR=1 FL=1
MQCRRNRATTRPRRVITRLHRHRITARHRGVATTMHVLHRGVTTRIRAIVKDENSTGGMTAMGAMIFFWGRLAYAVIYIAGIAWLRTVAWFVSVIGMALIAIELLKVI